MSGTVYTKDVLALSDHLFERFPTLSGLEILAIAAEAVEFYNSRGRETGNHLGDDVPDDTQRWEAGLRPRNRGTNEWDTTFDTWADDPQNGAPA